jgi:ribonuclease E
MKKEMLINVAQPEECRIAIIEDGVLEELYVERASQESYVGNIYKGKIVNIEPSIQAAFVDFGIGRNGFLHVSDVDPVYYKHLLPQEVLAQLEAEEEDGPASPRRERSGRGNPRDRDRGWDRDRDEPNEPRTMTSFLESEPTVIPPASYVDEEDETGFGSGLLDDEPPPASQTEEPPPLPQQVAPPPLPVARLSPPPPPAEPADPEESGFGSGLLDDEPVVIESRETVVEMEMVAEAAPVEPETDEPAAESETEPEAKKPARTRRTRKKTDGEETSAESKVDAEPEAKKPTRTRRTRKKLEGDDLAEAGGQGELSLDDKPRTMPGAERRTSPRDEPEIESTFGAGLDDSFGAGLSNESVAPADNVGSSETAEGATEADTRIDAERFDTEGFEDAGEIQPFFEGSTDDFDVSGPNDRFTGTNEPEPQREHGRSRRRRKDTTPTAIVPESGIEPIDTTEPAIDEDEGTFGEEIETEMPTAVVDEEEEDFTPPGFDEEGGEFVGRDRRRSGGRSRGRDRRPGGRSGNGSGRSSPRDRGFPRLPIEKIFKKGQEVIVQVIKEGIGTKGPTLSTYISIAGRYLVLMPSLNRVGVSRKIEDHDARRRLREIMTDLNPPKGVGFIVRTAAIDRDPKELQNDLAYLLRLWQVVVRRIQKVRAPVEIYRESDMITRTIRDNFKGDIDAIWVDDPTAYQHAQEFMQIVMPKYANRIKLHDSIEPLFHRFRLEEELAKINQKRIDMPRGGSIIIEQTEALVAIDVNSGNFRAENDAEETAYQMNLLAAKEIARQLRLRDLGGVIVNDFIDMRSETHRRNVEKALRDALSRDKARTKILRISQFGIIEMTRQRMQPSLKKRVYNDCPHCKGSGHVKTNETLGIEVMRMLQLAAYKAQVGTPPVTAVQVTVHADVAAYLLNKKRRDIAAMEDRVKMEVTITGLPGVSPDTLEFKCYDSNGNEVRLTNPGPPPRMFSGRPPSRFPERRYPAPLD